MDTLDSGVKDYGKILTYFPNNDNVKRISNQQDAPIFVVIGNPPYNATQTSFNNANPVNEYPRIDKMIYEDWTKKSSATKTKIDMYKRFLKWSSKRIKEKGIVAFISNNSFLNTKTNDGFRKAVYEEFDHIYTVNLRGDSRLAGNKDGENIFGISIGVVISFFIKTGKGDSSLQYVEVADYMKRDQKLKWLKDNTLSTLGFETITPTDDAVWLNQVDNNFDELLPILPRDSKESIFDEVTIGVSTNKDGWMYDLDKSNLKKKMKYYIKTYNKVLKQYKIQKLKITDLSKWADKKIKWSRDTLRCLTRERSFDYSDKKITSTLYRPFVTKYQYYDREIIDVPGKFSNVFKNSQKNLLICFTNPTSRINVFETIGTNSMTDVNLLTGGGQNIPLWKYDGDGKQQSNITQYGLEQFQKHYESKKITDKDIFYYTYAILNDPKYDEKYRYNLQRSFPRIPLAKDFEKFKNVGKKLFNLHSQFNEVKEYDLTRRDKPINQNNVNLSFKKELKTKKKQQEEDYSYQILIDDKTSLHDIPKEVFEYAVGPKNPIKWILAYYKEDKNEISFKLCNDESIRKRFNNYNFENHKEKVITLLKKVTTVCVETVKLRNQLKEMEWGPQPKFKFTKLEDKKSEEKAKPKKAKKSKKAKSRKTKNQKMQFV